MRRLLGTVLLASALVAGVVPSAAWATSDSWLTMKTKMALLSAEGMTGGKINVDTVNGRVTLHGTVPTAADKAKAEAEARKIDGVTEVRNLIQVVPKAKQETVKAADAEVKSRVEKALRDDPRLASDDVHVASVNDGVVLLSGETKTASGHLRAMQTASAVPGVVRVTSEVKSPDKIADAEIRERTDTAADSGTKRSVTSGVTDAWITTATKMRLLADGDTPALDINVDTQDGVVTLFGIVGTAEAKRAAEAEARKVSGVTRVENELQVVPKAKQETVKARDEDVQAAVKRSLEGRENLRDAKIAVEVRNGVARLTGAVASQEDRLEAAVVARSTAGVRAVEDALQVNPKL
jgi:osmotically-inducible protein OsmY